MKRQFQAAVPLLDLAPFATKGQAVAVGGNNVITIELDSDLGLVRVERLNPRLDWFFPVQHFAHFQ